MLPMSFDASCCWRLTRARERLLSQTRQVLADRLSLRHSELDSIMRLVDSQLEISVVRLFGAGDAAPP